MCNNPLTDNPFFKIEITCEHVSEELKDIVDFSKSPIENLTEIERLSESRSIGEPKKFDLEPKNGLFIKAFRNGEITWAGFEQSYYDELVFIHKSFLNQNKDFNIKEVEARKILELNSLFKDIKDEFIKYLKEEIEPKISRNDLQASVYFEDCFEKLAIDRKADEDEEVFRKLMGDKPKAENVLFLCFNYTQVLENVYNISNESSEDLSQKVINIHGELSNLASIIFGYGDEMDNDFNKMENYQNSILEHFKSFQYARNDNYHRLEAFVESGPFQVDIIGHSCGTCDRVMLNYIFQNDFCNRLRIHYYENNKGENNFIDTYMNLSRHFSPDQKHK